MLLIGSEALRVHGISTGRKSLDTDVIATFDELQELTRALRKQTKVISIPMSGSKTVLKCTDGRIFEVELAWDGTSGRALFTHPETIVSGPLTEVAGIDALALSVDQLYTLKMSHRYLKNSPHFRKTRNDTMLLRARGARIFDESWLKQREYETYWYKHPKLNVDKGDFFKGDGVQYVYDHDTIHVSMSHLYDPPFASYEGPPKHAAAPKVPAYTRYMKDGAQVQTDKRKFFAAPEQVRLYGVLEEAQVLALERSQIPFRGKVDPRRSFDIALQKVCTSITSGYFREYAWENFDKVEAMYEPDYVDRFWKAVESGIVRKLGPDEVPSY